MTDIDRRLKMLERFAPASCDAETPGAALDARLQRALDYIGELEAESSHAAQLLDDVHGALDAVGAPSGMPAERVGFLKPGLVCGSMCYHFEQSQRVRGPIASMGYHRGVRRR